MIKRNVAVMNRYGKQRQECDALASERLGDELFSQRECAGKLSGAEAAFLRWIRGEKKVQLEFGKVEHILCDVNHGTRGDALIAQEPFEIETIPLTGEVLILEDKGGLGAIIYRFLGESSEVVVG